MTDKKDDDLTKELLAKYGMDKEPAESKPAKVEEKVEQVVESAPQEVELTGNPFVDLENKQAKEVEAAPVQNVFQRSPTATLVGGAAGAMAQYKGLGTGLFNPDPELFAPKPVTMPAATTGAAAAPMTDVQHTMQSAQGERSGVTGRQRESAHNWETNRQALAQQQGLSSPGAKSVVVNAGPMHPTQAGVAVPQHVAVSLEEELRAKQLAQEMERQQLLARQAELQKRQMAAAQRRAAVAGAARGVGRIGQGVVGGALAAPQLTEYARDVANQRPADQTQLASGLGGLLMALSRGKAGAVGALAQIPYAVKHREELARSMNLSDINPTAFMGMPEELSPAFRELQPRRPSPTDMPPPVVPRGLP